MWQTELYGRIFPVSLWTVWNSSCLLSFGHRIGWFAFQDHRRSLSQIRMCALVQVQGDQPTSKPWRCPNSVLYHTPPPLCQPPVLTAQRLCVTGGGTGCASLSFALCSRELRCCRKWGSSEVVVTIATRALPVSCLASHTSSIFLVSSRPSPWSAVVDTEEFVYSGCHSIRHPLPLQEEATGRQPEDLFPAPSSLRDPSCKQQHKLVLSTILL